VTKATTNFLEGSFKSLTNKITGSHHLEPFVFDCENFEKTSKFENFSFRIVENILIEFQTWKSSENSFAIKSTM